MATMKLEEVGSTRDSFSSQGGLTKSSNSSDNKLLVGAVVLLACVAIVAIIIAAVALSKASDQGDITVNAGTGSTGSAASSGAAPAPMVLPSGGASGGRRIFTIAVGHDWGAHNYLDKEGYITGFTKEVIAEVCQAAGVDCVTVWDKWSNCYDSIAGQHGVGGDGLMGRWYDACSGWARTASRVQVFSFGTSYLRPTLDSFFVKKGTTFDWKDIRNKKIGFLDGWATDEKCVARQKTIQGNIIPLDKIVHYPSPIDAVTALQNGEVDALASDALSLEQWLQRDEIEKKGEFSCVLAGGTAMTRKDGDFIQYWNYGFSKIQSSGRFKKMCDEATKNHGHMGEIKCV